MQEEIWKDIKDYEGLYQVSNLGRVRSIPRRGTCKTLHILKPGKNHKNYLQVRLTKNSKGKTFVIHRLVAKSFILNPNDYPQVNHIDGNKLNNCVDNLEWCTNEYNMKEACRLGLRDNIYKKGKEHCRSVSINQYDLQGKFIKKWFCVKDIERELNFDNRNICACARHKKKSAYGYIWRYENDTTELIYKPNSSNKYIKSMFEKLFS